MSYTQPCAQLQGNVYQYRINLNYPDHEDYCAIKKNGEYTLFNSNGKLIDEHITYLEKEHHDLSDTSYSIKDIKLLQHFPLIVVKNNHAYYLLNEKFTLLDSSVIDFKGKHFIQYSTFILASTGKVLFHDAYKCYYKQLLLLITSSTVIQIDEYGNAKNRWEGHLDVYNDSIYLIRGSKSLIRIDQKGNQIYEDSTAFIGRDHSNQYFYESGGVYDVLKREHVYRESTKERINFHWYNDDRVPTFVLNDCVFLDHYDSNFKHWEPKIFDLKERKYLILEGFKIVDHCIYSWMPHTLQSHMDCIIPKNQDVIIIKQENKYALLTEDSLHNFLKLPFEYDSMSFNRSIYHQDNEIPHSVSFIKGGKSGMYNMLSKNPTKWQQLNFISAATFNEIFLFYKIEEKGIKKYGVLNLYVDTILISPQTKEQLYTNPKIDSILKFEFCKTKAYWTDKNGKIIRPKEPSLKIPRFNLIETSTLDLDHKVLYPRFVYGDDTIASYFNKMFINGSSSSENYSVYNIKWVKNMPVPITLESELISSDTLFKLAYDKCLQYLKEADARSLAHVEMDFKNVFSKYYIFTNKGVVFQPVPYYLEDFVRNSNILIPYTEIKKYIKPNSVLRKYL